MADTRGTRSRLCSEHAYLVLTIFSCPYKGHCDSTAQLRRETGWSAIPHTLQGARLYQAGAPHKSRHTADWCS